MVLDDERELESAAQGLAGVRVQLVLDVLTVELEQHVGAHEARRGGRRAALHFAHEQRHAALTPAHYHEVPELLATRAPDLRVNSTVCNA